MARNKISINIEQIRSAATQPPSPGLCEYVQELIDDVESGYPSLQSWKMLRRLFNRLARSPKLNSRQKQAFELMEPIMLKYGQSDTDGVNLAAAYPHEGCDTFQYSEKK